MNSKLFPVFSISLLVLLSIAFPVKIYAQSFTPVDIIGGNLQLWLDSSDLDGDGSSLNDPLDGATIATWVDKSGNNKNATQAIVGFQPTFSASSLNGKSTVAFPGGTTKYLQSGTVSDWNFLHNGSESTVFIVAKGTTADNNTDFMISTGGAGVARGFSFGRAGQFSGGGLFSYLSDGVGGYPFEAYPSTAVGNNFGVFSLIQKSSPVFKLYENGIVINSVNSYTSAPSLGNAGSPLSIGIAPDGFSRPLSGNIAEIIIFNRALSARERIDVQAYLQNKWNQPTTLSDDIAPTLSAFTSTSTNGSYGVGQRINITANFSENLAMGSTMTVSLDSGSQVVLNTISGNTLSGTYTVRAGQSSEDLTVSSILSSFVSDKSENVSTVYTVPLNPNNIADTKNIIINTTTLPEAPFVIIAGQSNALGRAQLSGITRFDGTSNVKILDQVNGSFQVLQQGVNQHYTNPTTQFGPEMGMAYLYKDEGSTKPLYILKYAIGGTQLASGAGNDWNPNSTGEYFDTLISLTQTAFEQINAAGYTPKLLGVVWMQGENDATSLSSANAYSTNLTNLINRTRDRLSISDLPYVVGRIRQDDPVAPYASTVRSAQSTVVLANSNTCLIDTDDLVLFDQVHFNPVGQMTLGGRFWNALKKCDSVKPVLNTKIINNNVIILTFDEPINTYSAPMETAFTLKVNGLSRSISAISIANSEVTLLAATPVSYGDQVTLEYSAPVTNKITDWSLNAFDSISAATEVLNITPQPSRVGGGRLITQCSNGIDDDNDGVIDLKDVGCKGQLLGMSEGDKLPTNVLLVENSSVSVCKIAFSRILRVTNFSRKNTDVKDLQACLNFRLKMNPPLIADGVFGLKTKQAVMLFQKNNKLRIDGVVGADTRAVLNF